MREMNPQRKVHIGTVVLVLSVIAGPLAVWGDSQLERGETKEKIKTIERRQDEDRRDTRVAINEVKEHVKQIDQNVQVILQKITAMEAVKKLERRR